MYLLRELRFEGTAVSNPYLTSVGIDREEAIRRLRKIPHLGFHRQGELISFEMAYPSLMEWAVATGLVEIAIAEEAQK